jgi:hypothetical protein
MDLEKLPNSEYHLYNPLRINRTCMSRKAHFFGRFLFKPYLIS